MRSDAGAVPRAEEMIDVVESRSVLLLRDERSHSVVLLDRLLPALKARGFNLAPSLRQIL